MKSTNKSILVCRRCDKDIDGADVSTRVSTSAGPMHRSCYQLHAAAVDAWFKAAEARGAWKQPVEVASG